MENTAHSSHSRAAQEDKDNEKSLTNVDEVEKMSTTSDSEDDLVDVEYYVYDEMPYVLFDGESSTNRKTQVDTTTTDATKDSNAPSEIVVSAEDDISDKQVERPFGLGSTPKNSSITQAETMEITLEVPTVDTRLSLMEARLSQVEVKFGQAVSEATELPGRVSKTRKNISALKKEMKSLKGRLDNMEACPIAQSAPSQSGNVSSMNAVVAPESTDSVWSDSFFVQSPHPVSASQVSFSRTNSPFVDSGGHYSNVDAALTNMNLRLSAVETKMHEYGLHKMNRDSLHPISTISNPVPSCSRQNNPNPVNPSSGRSSRPSRDPKKNIGDVECSKFRKIYKYHKVNPVTRVAPEKVDKSQQCEEQQPSTQRNTSTDEDKTSVSISMFYISARLNQVEEVLSHTRNEVINVINRLIPLEAKCQENTLASVNFDGRLNSIETRLCHHDYLFNCNKASLDRLNGLVEPRGGRLTSDDVKKVLAQKISAAQHANRPSPRETNQVNTQVDLRTAALMEIAMDRGPFKDLQLGQTNMDAFTLSNSFPNTRFSFNSPTTSTLVQHRGRGRGNHSNSPYPFPRGQRFPAPAHWNPSPSTSGLVAAEGLPATDLTTDTSRKAPMKNRNSQPAPKHDGRVGKSSRGRGKARMMDVASLISHEREQPRSIPQETGPTFSAIHPNYPALSMVTPSSSNSFEEVGKKADVPTKAGTAARPWEGFANQAMRFPLLSTQYMEQTNRQQFNVTASSSQIVETISQQTKVLSRNPPLPSTDQTRD